MKMARQIVKSYNSSDHDMENQVSSGGHDHDDCLIYRHELMQGRGFKIEMITQTNKPNRQVIRIVKSILVVLMLTISIVIILFKSKEHQQQKHRTKSVRDTMDSASSSTTNATHHLRSSTTSTNEDRFFDNLSNVDFQMCLDLLDEATRIPSVVPSQQPHQVVHIAKQMLARINYLTANRFGSWSQLSPSIQSQLCQWVDWQQQQLHRLQDDNLNLTWPNSNQTISNIARPPIQLVQPLCEHLIHVAQVMIIPFQFQITLFSPASSSSSSSLLSLLSQLLTSWQQLAPFLIQTNGFHCNDTSIDFDGLDGSHGRLLQGTTHQHNLFRHDSSSQKHHPVTPATTSTCPYTVQASIKKVLPHVECIPQKFSDMSSSASSSPSCHFISFTTTILKASHQPEQNPTTTNVTVGTQTATIYTSGKHNKTKRSNIVTTVTTWTPDKHHQTSWNALERDRIRSVAQTSLAMYLK